MYEESRRLRRQARQSWQKLYKNIKKHPPYSPILAPGDFFLLRKAKEGLVGQSLDQDSFKNTWEGVARSLIAATLPLSLEACWSAPKSASALTVSLSKNLKK
jgi:hypothetical protein